MIDFENIEARLVEKATTPEYHSLIDKVNKAKKIFLIGNGGLHYVASHMATDLSRLIPDKAVFSFDSVGFITSNANDHGYENLFARWLETVARVEDPNGVLVIGLSCSGNSSNVIQGLHWADENNFDTFMISGETSDHLRDDIEEMSLHCDYFHTVEVMTMMLFYDLIKRTGNHCPSIRQEKVRLADSPLRGGTSRDD
jgi:phosphoheptose isomerase